MIGLAAVLMLGAGAAVAQDGDATQRANRLAYDYAMRCFVANSVAVSDRRNAGDTAGASTYEAQARRSFDTALKIGGALNFSGAHMNEDFGLAQSTELPKMVSDRAYYRKVVGDCKALGLM